MLFGMPLLALAVSAEKSFPGMDIESIETFRDDSLVEYLDLPPPHKVAAEWENPYKYTIGVGSKTIKSLRGSVDVKANVIALGWKSLKELPKNLADFGAGEKVKVDSSYEWLGNRGNITFHQITTPLLGNTAVDFSQEACFKKFSSAASEAKILLTVSGTIAGENGKEEVKKLFSLEIKALKADEVKCRDILKEHCPVDEEKCKLEECKDNVACKDVKLYDACANCDSDHVFSRCEAIDGVGWCMVNGKCNKRVDWVPPVKPTIWGRILKVLGWFFRGYQPGSIGINEKCNRDDDNCDHFEFYHLTCLHDGGEDPNNGTCRTKLGDECKPVENNVCEKGNVCEKVVPQEKGELSKEKHICKIGVNGNCDPKDSKCGMDLYCQQDSFDDSYICKAKLGDECKPDNNMCGKGNVCEKVVPQENGELLQEKHICRIGVDGNCDQEDNKCGMGMYCKKEFIGDSYRCKVALGASCDPEESRCDFFDECKETEDGTYTCQKWN